MIQWTCFLKSVLMIQIKCVYTNIQLLMSLTSQSNRNAKKLRIVFLGDQGVGKTSIIQRYTSQRFDENYNSTVGIDFNVKDVSRTGNIYRLQMWDTAGQERYRSLIPTYLKNAHCVLFVFDVTNSKSLANLQSWYKLFQQHQQAPGIVVGNKIDLSAARKIERIQGQKLSKQKNLHYVQVSAKYGKKIPQLFDLVLDLIIESQNQKDNFDLHDDSKKGMREANQEGLGHINKKIQLKKETLTAKVSKACCPQG